MNRKMIVPHQGSLYVLTDEELDHCSAPGSSSNSEDGDSSNSKSTKNKKSPHPSYLSTQLAIYGITILVRGQDEHQILDEERVDAEGCAINTTHVLRFTRSDCEFTQRLFAILDTESRGYIEYSTLEEFVRLRCPALWRRDDSIRQGSYSGSHNHWISERSPTFDEIWRAVMACCPQSPCRALEDHHILRREARDNYQLGMEGLLVFCRYLALAQYHEAKRRFEARHRQQTMRHRNAPRGTEMVVVEVPPEEPPTPITPLTLVRYEEVQSQLPLPLPELDLDHSLVAAHDCNVSRQKTLNSTPSSRMRCRRSGCRNCHRSEGHVRVNLFRASSNNNLEFTLTYYPDSSQSDMSTLVDDPITVRRSLSDLQWLDDTFSSHRSLGGTLCGRILPIFPGANQNHHSIASSSAAAVTFLSSATNASSVGSLGMVGGSKNSDGSVAPIRSTSEAALAAASASVNRLRSVARFFTDSIASAASTGVKTSTSESASGSPSPSSSSHSTGVRPSGGKRSALKRFVIPESYYNPNSPAGKCRHLERYLNFLLEHPAMSTSFPLNTILKVRLKVFWLVSTLPALHALI
jgi:hypothetical protein